MTQTLVGNVDTWKVQNQLWDANMHVSGNTQCSQISTDLNEAAHWKAVHGTPMKAVWPWNPKRTKFLVCFTRTVFPWYRKKHLRVRWVSDCRCAQCIYTQKLSTSFIMPWCCFLNRLSWSGTPRCKEQEANAMDDHVRLRWLSDQTVFIFRLCEPCLGKDRWCRTWINGGIESGHCSAKCLGGCVRKRKSKRRTAHEWLEWSIGYWKAEFLESCFPLLHSYGARALEKIQLHYAWVGTI